MWVSVETKGCNELGVDQVWEASFPAYLFRYWWIYTKFQNMGTVR